MPYTLIADSHQISAYQQCERRYYYYDIRHLRPKSTSKALNLGTIFHEALSKHYRGLAPQETWAWLRNNELLGEISQEQNEKFPNDKPIDYQALLARRYLEYCKEYKGRDWQGDVIAVEHTNEDGSNTTGFSKVIYEDQLVRFIYEGQIDLIVKPSGVLEWVDHKTQGARYPFDRNEYVHQFLGYSWALGCHNGVINYITWSDKVTPKTFRRQSVSFGRDLIEEWRTEVIQTFYRMLKDMFSNEWERKRAACDTKYGPCVFQPICTIVNPNGQEWKIKQAYQQVERRFAWTGPTKFLGGDK